MKVGVGLKPGTKVDVVTEWVDQGLVDMVLGDGRSHALHLHEDVHHDSRGDCSEGAQPAEVATAGDLDKT